MLQVDPNGLIIAAQHIAEALADVVGGDPAHPPLGADPASAGGAARLSTAAALLITALGEQTLGLAATAAQLLNVSAGFVEQDLFNKSGLQKLGIPDVITVPGWAPPSPPIPPDLRPPLLPPPPLPAEVVSAAVHSGDPNAGEAFIGAWARVVSSAEAAADVVRSAADQLPEAWDSPVSTDTVRAHLYRYADAFDDSASRARTLTQQASWHGEQIAQARSDIPPPQQFEALRHQIQTVSAANIAAGGKYTPQLNSLLAEKTALDTKAVDGYGTYHSATDKTTAGDTGAGEPRDSAGDPLSGKDPQASGEREKLTPEKAGQLASQLPQMMSAVLGAAGGLVGGVFGSLGKVPETLMQAGSQMAGQLSQSLGGMMKGGLDTGGAEKYAALDKASAREGLGASGKGGGGAGTLPAGGGGSPSIPAVRPTTGAPPNLPTMPAGGLPAPAAPSSPAAGSSGAMPMGMPLGGLAGAAHGGGAGGQTGEQGPPARPKKVVLPPEPHTESVTGKVASDRIALSGGGSTDRDPNGPDDDPPGRPVVRRITMPSRDDDT